jgi:hypothetical protein
LPAAGPGPIRIRAALFRSSTAWQDYGSRIRWARIDSAD